MVKRMTVPLLFKVDKVGISSELKLEIIEKHGSAYAKTFTRVPRLKKYYIDGFSCAGVHLSKTTKVETEGSPARALKMFSSFDGFFFIDMNAQKTSHLQSLCEGRSDVHIYTEDANTCLTREVLPKIEYSRYTRALCLLDLYRLHMDCEVMRMAGQSKAVDVFSTFR